MDTASLWLLLLGLCVGLLWLTSVLISFCCKEPEPRKLTVFNVSLVFTALLQSLSTPVKVILLIGRCWLSWEHCHKFVLLWHASRHLGMFLHLLVVLEFTLANPRYGSKLKSVYVSLPIVLTLVVVCMLFSEGTSNPYDIVYGDYIGLGAAASALTVVTCATAGLSWCTRRSPLDKREVIAIVMAVFTFATYAPSFVMLCMTRTGIPVDLSEYGTMVCLSNMRLVADANLCWQVTRESAAPPLQADALVALENMAEGQRIHDTDQTVPGLSLGGDVGVPTAQGATGDRPNYWQSQEVVSL